ncbi:uncharacterized protein LOC104064848 isoform X6 [Cuculus canorus]|uniref:uncharacterized protein LOC104064848 isoform X6 n=1 Tax=Cuculus canorus TaxID=55661 RepID=UPI0023AB0D73|nr:uncharacterized protein LOC104064848 isoform X6 [Cuculus canorus]
MRLWLGTWKGDTAPQLSGDREGPLSTALWSPNSLLADESPSPGEQPGADLASPGLAIPSALALAGLLGSSGTSPSGIVAKHGKNHLLRMRGAAKVLRRKEGLDVATLQHRIRMAMDQAVEYDAITYNCVHFALALLGLGQLAGATVGATTLRNPDFHPTECHHSPASLPGVPSTAVMEAVMCTGDSQGWSTLPRELEDSSMGEQPCAGGFGIPLT